eukprot:3672450-Pyramimonas_sp.AAC.1
MGKYPEQTTTVVADTPKADGSQAVDRFSEPLTAIAGDPVHDAAASASARPGGSSGRAAVTWSACD